MNDAERRIVVVNDGSDQRRVVVERGQAAIVIRGAEQRIQVAVGGGGGGGSGNALLGVPVIFNEISAGDVLQFNGSAIVNTNQTELTDGGNF